MKILFLDDDKARHRKFREWSIGCEVVFVFTYEEAIKALEEHVFDEAHLDHDLSEEAAMGLPVEGEKTGLDVAKHIAAMLPDKRPERVVVHSFNDAGARWMGRVLRDAGVRVILAPFGGGRR